MRSYAARIMRQPEESICPDRSLFELGMDSLMAAEFVLMLDRNSWVRILNPTGIAKSWRKVARDGLEVRLTPGNHYDMLRGENTKVLATALNDCLKRSGSGKDAHTR